MKRAFPTMQTLAAMDDQNNKRLNMMVALAVGSAMRELGLNKLEIKLSTMVEVANGFTVSINTDEKTSIQTFELIEKPEEHNG